MGLMATPQVDPIALDALIWNVYIPGPRTIFLGVEKLLPGHAWSLGRDGTPRELVHWQPDFFHADETLDEEEWLDRVEDALTTAVKRRLIADVPVGVMLSGGRFQLGDRIGRKGCGTGPACFSVANEDPAEDETAYALAVASAMARDIRSFPCARQRAEGPAHVRGHHGGADGGRISRQHVRHCEDVLSRLRWR